MAVSTQSSRCPHVQQKSCVRKSVLTRRSAPRRPPPPPRQQPCCARLCTPSCGPASPQLGARGSSRPRRGTRHGKHLVLARHILCLRPRAALRRNWRRRLLRAVCAAVSVSGHHRPRPAGPALHMCHGLSHSSVCTPAPPAVRCDAPQHALRRAQPSGRAAGRGAGRAVGVAPIAAAAVRRARAAGRVRAPLARAGAPPQPVAPYPRGRCVRARARVRFQRR